MARREVPTQLIVGLAILLLGGGFLGGEYFLVKWYPNYEQRRAEKTLELLPYRNDSLGIEAQVAAGLYGKLEDFPNGVRIFRPKFWSIGPSLIITSQPNPDHTFEFTPEVLAKWQTEGVHAEIPRYRFEHAKINNRDAVLIWQFRNRAMLLTVRVISPDRIIDASCTPGREDEDLFLRACEMSLRTLRLAGPDPPPTPGSGIIELASPLPSSPPRL